MWIRPHPARPLGRQRRQFGAQRAGVVEQLLGTIGAHPRLELLPVPAVGADVSQRHLMGAEAAFGRKTVDDLGTGPALRRAQHDHRPPRPPAPRPERAADWISAIWSSARSRAAGQQLVDRRAGRRWRRPTAHSRSRAAAHRARRRRSAPAPSGWRSCSRSGARSAAPRRRARRSTNLFECQLAASGPVSASPSPTTQQTSSSRVVERRTVGVQQSRSPARRPRGSSRASPERRGSGSPPGTRTAGTTAGSPPRRGRWRIDLAVGPLQVSVGHQPRAAMTRASHIDRVQIATADLAIHVRVDQVQSRSGAPVAQQSRLDVLRQQWLAQQRVVEQVDLADRQVVRRSPVGMDQVTFVRLHSRPPISNRFRPVAADAPPISVRIMRGCGAAWCERPVNRRDQPSHANSAVA